MSERNHLWRARARFAFEAVENWGSWKKDATQRVKGLPVQLRTQGLPVTIATLLREDKVNTRELAHLIARWVMDEAPHKPLPKQKPQAKDLLEACIRADRASYMAAQTEALSLLEQVKLFADALHGTKGDT